MEFVRKNWGALVVIVLAVTAVSIRLQLYGDLRLSIANNDTSSYVASADGSLLSWEAFTGRRLFSTNVIYNLLRPDGGYEILVNGSYDTVRRQVQPGFVKIVLLQAILSMVGWSVLTLAITSRIQNNLLRITAAFVMLIFAFVPQVADWDTVLTSESLTYSLFALQLALLFLLAFRLAKNPKLDTRAGLLISGLLITVFFWTFLRDTNLYGLIVDLMMILGLLVVPRFRQQRYLFAIVLALAAIFLLGWISSGQSIRLHLAMKEVFSIVILGEPARVEFMQAHGMPESSSPEYDQWFAKKAKSAYIKFLIQHPGFVVTLSFRDMLKAFAVNIQPYFNTTDLPARNALIPLGDAMHPASPAPFFLDIILLVGLWAISIKKKYAAGGTWAWLATWMFLFASVNMVVVILGDAYGLTRHALLATTIFRLFMWLYPIVLIDLALLPERETLSEAQMGPIEIISS